MKPLVENLGPDAYLSEITGISKEEILERAKVEFERMVAEGTIKMLVTPYGRFIVLDHPLLREDIDAQKAYLFSRTKKQEVP